MKPSVIEIEIDWAELTLADVPQDNAVFFSTADRGPSDAYAEQVIGRFFDRAAHGETQRLGEPLGHEEGITPALELFGVEGGPEDGGVLGRLVDDGRTPERVGEEAPDEGHLRAATGEEHGVQVSRPNTDALEHAEALPGKGLKPRLDQGLKLIAAQPPGTARWGREVRLKTLRQGVAGAAGVFEGGPSPRGDHIGVEGLATRRRRREHRLHEEERTNAPKESHLDVVGPEVEHQTQAVK